MHRLRWAGRFFIGQVGEQWWFSAYSIELVILTPVHWKRHDLGGSFAEQPLHHFERQLGRHTSYSQQRKAPGQTPAAFGLRESQLGPCSPVDAQGWQALSLSMMRERVEETVSGGVVA